MWLAWAFIMIDWVHHLYDMFSVIDLFRTHTLLMSLAVSPSKLTVFQTWKFELKEAESSSYF